MYGDHHVVEVRRILLALPGVKEVNASSCFHVAQIEFDPAETDAQAINAALEEAGYLQEMSLPLESGAAAYGRNDGDTYFRHTAAYAQVKQTVSFAQSTETVSRPLWPCPGLGTIPHKNGEEGDN